MHTSPSEVGAVVDRPHPPRSFLNTAWPLAALALLLLILLRACVPIAPVVVPPPKAILPPVPTGEAAVPAAAADPTQPRQSPPAAQRP
jgi:hypothetical protein